MGATEVTKLNAQLAIAGQVSFREIAGGLVVAEVGNSHATAMVALQGAHVMTWTRRRERSVIWLSRVAKLAPGKSIRGGVPICWPWFGPHATEPKFPAHGFARTVPWDVIDTRGLRDGRTLLALRISASDAARAQWPYPSTLEVHITVGQTLEIELVTRNTGSAPITVGDALHTYFEVSDVRQIAIHGLGGCPYLDKVDGGKRRQQRGPVTIASEVDRIYLDSVADCLIDDPRWRRRIRVTKRGSRSTVVWNPWAEKAAKMGDFGDAQGRASPGPRGSAFGPRGPSGFLNMVCVESANAADDIVTIAPGGEHRLWVRYGVETLR